MKSSFICLWELGTQQVTSHYLNKCRSSLLMHVCITRPQQVQVDGLVQERRNSSALALTNQSDVAPWTTHHARLHLAHGVEIQFLLAVVEAADYAVIFRLSVQDGETRQVPTEVMRELRVTTWRDIRTNWSLQNLQNHDIFFFFFLKKEITSRYPWK